jgi:hypothetical protein
VDAELGRQAIIFWLLLFYVGNLGKVGDCSIRRLVSFSLCTVACGRIVLLLLLFYIGNLGKVSP